MEMTNKSTLRQIYILFAAVGVVSTLTCIIQFLGLPIDFTCSRILSVVFSLAMIAMVAWASAKGRSIGVKIFGSICGWAYVALALIVAGLVQWQYQVINSYESSMFVVSHIITAAADFFAIVALSLFIIGTKTNTLIKVLIPIMIFISYLVSSFIGVISGWLGFYSNWIFYLGTILYFITWTLMLILSITWKTDK